MAQGVFMKAIELVKAYNPKDFEDKIYTMWKDGGYFVPHSGDGDPYVIIIPPPNVTGILHMGHGLNNTLQDLLVRYWRMKGRPALWVPGTDHAGIATQNVLERRLKAQGKSRHDLGRQKFIEETWKVKEEHHGIITRQLETIGASCDWSRERFTMDEGCSKAVREVFVSLYERGLLYRGEYLVNWCSSCGTALADDEVEHEEKQGGLWEIDYQMADGNDRLSVVTTRPETMFGDLAVAVHPEDERYRGYIGRLVRLPIAERNIPVIADSHVDRSFGTGCLKVTPAHDANDYEIGRHHNLGFLNVMNPDGTMNENAPSFVQGIPSIQARKATVKKLEELGVLRSHKEHRHQIGHCYRCGTVIEPLLSKQWFVRMKPMAAKALAAWKNDEIRFYPKKWENTYRYWLENLRDWCVSRQIWWGHQIPAWTCASCGKLHVLRVTPKSCPDCGGQLQRDPDVLDTWFSSWLWPFSTLGWPEKTADLAKFYPTATLVTGYDIIFFWVARMIMAGLEFMGKVPFRDVYITGLIRDKQGRKMAKSLGNGIDPMDVVDKYGADAMKFTLVYLSAQGEDIPLDMDSCKIGSKFANKIWNAARFILINLDGRRLDNLSASGTVGSMHEGLALAHRWIWHRFNQAVKSVNEAMSSYRFDDMAHAVYEYFWNDYCDWYVEASKLGLYGDDEDLKDETASMLMQALKESLKLLHPFLPFITEEIWSKLPGENTPLIVSCYPEVDDTLNNPEVEARFDVLRELVVGVRTLRSEFTIPVSKSIKVRMEITGRPGNALRDTLELAAMLIRSDDIQFTSDESHDDSIPVIGKGFVAHVFIKDSIDIGAAVKRYEKSLEKTERLIEAKRRKLANEKFISCAPDEVVNTENASLAALEDIAARSQVYLGVLKGESG